MIKITIYNNPLQRDECEEIEGEALWPSLMAHFGEKFPNGARLYYQEEAEDHDITPLDEADALAIADCPGPFIVRVGAREGMFWTIVISTTIALLSAAASFLLAPSIPKQQNTSTSSNNQLSDRKNQARPHARIPDIGGEVWSTPDLIQLPYRMFDANSQEYEIALMCIGRGEYAIEAADVRDGETKVSEIIGESVEVYAPFTSPNSGITPQLRVGDPIGRRVVNARKSNSVDGQTLYAPNYKLIDATVINGYFRDGTHLYSTNTGTCNFTKYVEAGDWIRIEMDTFTEGANSANLTGTYLVDSVEDYKVLLHEPQLVNSGWNELIGFASNRIAFSASHATIDAFQINQISGIGVSRTAGPFEMNDVTETTIVNNFVAPNGLYKSSGNTVTAFPITIRVTIQPTDGIGHDVGTPTTHDIVVPSSTTDFSQRAVTQTISYGGTCKVSAVRVTPGDYNFSGQVSDEVKWRDLYAMSDVAQDDFGNVTTVQALTRVTPQAIGVKERKLNMKVCRKVKILNSDGTFGAGHTTFALAPLVASKNAADIFCFFALDPRVGRQTEDQVDGEQICSEAVAVIAEFGDVEAAEFGGTFDDDDVSGEDILNAIAKAAFCEPCRRGELIQLVFERATDSSAMVLGHRTCFDQKRSDVFGTVNDSDGVTFNYVDKNNFDAPKTYSLPLDGSATRPKKVDSIGIRNYSQAYWAAWREWQKIQYQNLSCEVTALESASILTRLERVAVADNTEPCAIPGCALDGEVRVQGGLTLTLSQKVPFETGKAYAIILQHKDATTEAITITDGAAPKQVVLANAPNQSLVFGKKQNTTYLISVDEDETNTAFLVSEKTEAEGNNYALKLVNYDARYYAKDLTTPE